MDRPGRAEFALVIALACGAGLAAADEDDPAFARRARAAAAREAPVAIRFRAYRDGDGYLVEAGGASCRTPCTLQLRPGKTRLDARGSGEVHSEIVVPHLPGEVRLQHDSSSGYRISGGLLVPFGIVASFSLWSLVLACGNDACRLFNIVSWPLFGTSLLTYGIALLAITPKHRPPVDANRVEILDARAPRLRLSSVGIAPMPSGLTAGLGFVF